jgi:type II secretory pathway component GspD/PulD (secretin)
MNESRRRSNRHVAADILSFRRTIVLSAFALIFGAVAEANDVAAPAPIVVPTPASAAAPIPDATQAQPQPQSGGTPSVPSTDPPAEGTSQQPVPSAGVAPAAGTSEAVPAPLAEGAIPATPNADAAAALPATPPVPEILRWAGGEGGFEFVAPTDAAQPEKVRFGFQETPWPVVLEQFARWEKLSLDLTDTPPGTFTYFDDQPRTPAEAVDVLNGYLLPRGYVVVRRHNFLVCVRTDSPQIADLIPTVSLDDLATRGEQELVRVVVRTPDVDPEAAALEIEQLLGQHGSAKPLKNLQAVVVQGFGRGLRDAVAVIDDVAPPAKADKLQFKSFPLRNIAAADAEKHVRDLFGLGSGTLNVSGARTEMERELRYRNWSGERRGGGDDNNNREQRPQNDRLLAQVTVNTQVSSVASTNNLLVTSTEEGLALIENVITSIDVPRSDGHGLGAAEKFLRVYATSDASAEEVAKTLDVLMPGVLVNEDRRQDSLHIYATAEQHLEVADLIRTLDGGGEGGRTVAVIPLRKYDAYAMSELLSGMFDNEDRDERPVIQPEVASRTLVVRGTTQQVEQVRSALAAYGEGQTDRASAPIGARFRTIEVHADDAENIVRTAERILAEAPGRDAGIRVVVPNSAKEEQPKVRVPSENVDPEDEEVSVIQRIELGDPSSAPVVVREVPSTADASSESDHELPAPQADDRDPSFAYIRTIAIEAPTAKTTDAAAEEVAEVAPAGVDQESEQPPAEEPAADDDTADKNAEKRPEEGVPPGAPEETPRVQAVVRDGKIQLYSTDQRALDEVEEIVRELARTMPARTNWTVFYLRAADASQTASTLYSLMPDAAISSLFAPSPYDPAGAGSTPEAFDVVPEPRTNALFVSGSSAQIERVEQLLEILDTVDVPPSLVARTPRSIPVRYADVNQIAALVQTLYKDRLTDPAAAQREEEARRQEGGDGRNRGDQASRGEDDQRRRQSEERAPRSQPRGARAQPAGPQLSIAVDPIARELIVSCDETLFREISEFVQSRDQIARDTRESVDIVRLPQSFPAESQAVLQVLQSISPNVTVNSVESPWSAATPAPGSSRSYDPRSYSGRSSYGGSYRGSRDSRSYGR